VVHAYDLIFNTILHLTVKNYQNLLTQLGARVHRYSLINFLECSIYIYICIQSGPKVSYCQIIKRVKLY